MRKVAVSLLVLLVALSSVVMAAAEGRVPQASSQGAADVLLAQPAPDVAWPDAVLWDQPLSTVNTAAYVDQEFTDAPTYSSFLADDFVNAEAWTLRNIWVPGDGWNGFSTLFNATSLNWMIFADAGGVPAGDPVSGGAFWSLSLAPNDLQVQISTGTSGYPSNTWLTPAVPPVIPAGHWWLIFYPTMAFSPYGQFGRQPADTLNGYWAQFINPGGAFGYGTAWQSWAVIGSTQQDIAFRLSGSKNLVYAAQYLMSYREPMPGKYKVIARVQIREASGPRVPGAEVRVEYQLPDGSYYTPGSQVTDAQGWAKFSLNHSLTGTYTVCVIQVTKAGYTYDPSLNVPCGTIVVP